MERNFLLALALSFLVLTMWTMYTAPPPDEAGPATASDVELAGDNLAGLIDVGVPVEVHEDQR